MTSHSTPVRLQVVSPPRPETTVGLRLGSCDEVGCVLETLLGPVGLTALELGVATGSSTILVGEFAAGRELTFDAVERINQVRVLVADLLDAGMSTTETTEWIRSTGALELIGRGQFQAAVAAAARRA